MIEISNEEEMLKGCINSEKDKGIIGTARDVVQKIWSSEVRIVKDYTDHGYEHSQRIISKLYEMYKTWPNVLTEKEIFFLLLGAYLHDICMQCDIKKHTEIKKLAESKYGAEFQEEYNAGTANSYTVEEQNEIRKNHHLLTGARLEYSFIHQTILSPLVKSIDADYLQALIDVCRFHSKLSIDECPAESELAGIRTRLVAAILRFGDELDIDEHRIHIETMKEFGYNVDNAVFWYLHARTKIQIKKSEIKLSVYLNDHDYEKFGTCINNIYIQKFKTKNKMLTDIMTKNGFSFFISEDSGVAKNPFAENIPQEIAVSLQEMNEKEVRGQLLKTLERTGSNPEDETLKKILDLLLGKEEKIEFMKKYKNEFLNEASRIKLLIDKIKTVCDITCQEVDGIVDKVQAISQKKSVTAIKDSEAVLEKVYKIFLAVQMFTTKQLVYLNNLGVRICVQVYSGQAQPYVDVFFRKYHENKDNPEVLKKYLQSEVYFDSYTFEQIVRVLRSYQEIIRFNTEGITFSDYYLCSDFATEKLLAVSVSGESNKIFVWDTKSKRQEPIAALGGLFESVAKVKIYRYKNETIVAACGKRQIYFWNLNSGKGEPIYISNAEALITDYVMFESMDEHLCVMGLVSQRIYLWKMFGNEKPVSFFAGERAVFVINNRLTDLKDDYECLGANSFGDNERPRIIRLTETNGLNFKKVAVLEIYDKIDIDKCSADGFGNRLNAYALEKKGDALYLVINTDVYLYDLKNEVLKKMVHHTGQRILGIRAVARNQCHSLLTYSIYQCYREKETDLLHCYQLQKNAIVEHKKWSVKPQDVSWATFSANGDSEDIFFCHLFSNTIYRIDSESNAITDFYTFPDIFSIVHMTSE